MFTDFCLAVDKVFFFQAVGAILNVPATGRRAGCAPALSSDWLNRLPRSDSAVSWVALFQQQMNVKNGPKQVQGWNPAAPGPGQK